MMVGVPYAPISVPYSLMSSDFGKLKSIMEILTPGLVFAADGKAFARAIEAAVPSGVEIVVTANPGERPATLFADLLAAQPTDAVDAAHAKVGPDTIAKILFTSGSTGYPKGVINTQRMLCSNQAMIRAGLAFVADEPPVVVDWLPWNHTFGGNHDFGMVLHNGGSFYIDEGKPLPGAIAATVRNLREIAPTIYFNVPKGFEMLLPYLRNDAALRKNFFSQLKVLFYAGAGLARHVWDELQEMAVATTGERIIFLSSLGSTETAPAALARTWESEQPGNIGVPMRGVELKLVPNGGKLEARLKGPNITPGYWRRPDLTKEAFDDEGFYKMGDALKFEDAGDPGKGPRVRRPPRRGFQARQRHLGERRRAARPAHRSLRAAGARRGDRRPQPRRHRRAGVSRHRGLPQACGPCRRRAARRGAGRSEIARRVQEAPQRAGAAEHRRLDPHLPADPDGRAALARRRRGHRQGLDQPARGAGPARRAGRGALRPRHPRMSLQSTNGNNSHGPQRTRRHRHRSRLRPRRRDRGASRQAGVKVACLDINLDGAKEVAGKSAASPSAATSPAPTMPRRR